MLYGKSWACLGVLVSAFVSSRTEAASTNQAAVSYIPPTLTLESDEHSEFLKERFLQEIVESDSTVFDRFSGPSSRLSWLRAQNALGSGSIDRWNNEGERMFSTIGVDSLRTALTEILPLGLWADYWQGRLADFIVRSVGNPQEEHIQVASISYSAVRSSWERENEKAGIQWGLRPWRTNPYLYFLFHAGRMEGRPLVIFEGRAGYSMFGSTKLESRLTFQLPSDFRIAASAAVDPAHDKFEDALGSHLGITLERIFSSRGRIPSGVFYLGFRRGMIGGANPRPENLFVTGLSRAW